MSVYGLAQGDAAGAEQGQQAGHGEQLAWALMTEVLAVYKWSHPGGHRPRAEPPVNLDEIRTMPSCGPERPSASAPDDAVGAT